LGHNASRSYAIKELFHFQGGSGDLTERAIYDCQPGSSGDIVKVFSGATDSENNLPVCSKKLIEDTGAPLILDCGILVARKGQAGSMRIVEGKFSFNDNAYAMTVRPKAIKVIDPLFFVIAYQDDFFDLVTSKDGNGTFAKSIAESLIVRLPKIEMQCEVADAWRKQESSKGRLNALLCQTQKLLDTQVRSSSERGVRVADLVNHFQGRQITDKELYIAEGKIPVISGADAIIKGYSNTPLILEEDLPCITYQTKGNTQIQLHTRTHIFDANNTAIMSIKKRRRDSVDIDFLKLPLRWKMRELQTSNESVSYIDTRILLSEIPMPFNKDVNELDVNEQRRIAYEYRRLQTIESSLKILIEGVEESMRRIRQLAVSIVAE